MDAIKKYKINAYLMAMYIFQFGFMQPVSSLVGSQSPIIFSTLVLLALMIYNNGLVFKKYVVYGFFGVSVYFFVNALIFNAFISVILIGYMEFMVKGFSAFVFGSLDTDEEDLFDAFMKVSIVNAVIMALFPFTTSMVFVNYMRFGYAIVPSAMMLLYGIAYCKKSCRALYIAFMLFIVSITVIYGSRGTIVVLLLFGLLHLLSSRRISVLQKISFLAVGGFIAAVVIKSDLLLNIIKFIRFDLHIDTYALEKLEMAISKGLVASSSGRELVYARALEHIADKLWLGNGIFYHAAMYGGWPHNLLIQILLESGILGLMVWIIIGVYCARSYIKMAADDCLAMHKIVTMILALALGRLLFSSDMWLRPEYWYVMSMLIRYNQRTDRDCSIKEV